MHHYVPGPTYTEMQQPWTLPAAVREHARAVRGTNELDPANLFNINWYVWKDGQPVLQKVVLPPALAELMTPFVPDLEKHLVSGSGHWAQQEKPDEVNRVLIDWLDRRFRAP